MKHHRRKIMTRVITFLLLGAIVNVGVAWAIGARLFNEELERQSLTISRDADPAWLVGINSRTGQTMLVLQSLGTEPVFEMFRRSHELSSSHILAMIPTHMRVVPADCFPQCAFVRMWCGWPMPSLSCELQGTLDYANKIVVELKTTHGINLVTPSSSMIGFRYRALPFLPLWPGFAVNTIFYAAVLWMLFAFPFAMTRRRRIKRGLCPACAYPVGTSPVCTECGAAVVRKLGAADC